MKEHFQTRTEHTRSLEDAEKYKALETLKELGLLVPYDEVETFHGRVAGADSPSWGVDPVFSNGGNDSGNNNVNVRPTLYTGSNEVAREFARARTADHLGAKINQQYQEQINAYDADSRIAWLNRVNDEQLRRWQALPVGQRKRRGPTTYSMADLSLGWIVNDEVNRLQQTNPDRYRAVKRRAASDLNVYVHDILATDRDATVLDWSFNPSHLSSKDYQRYLSALQKLSMSAVEGSPLDFADKDSVIPLSGVLKQYDQAKYLSQKDVVAIAGNAGVGVKSAQQVAGAVNARRIIRGGDPMYATRLLLGHNQRIVTKHLKGPKQKEFEDCPVNLEYIEHWLRQAHVVGVKHRINSATIGRNVSAISLFDLQKIDTKEAISKRREAMSRRLGSIVGNIEAVTNTEHPLLNLLEDAHAKPRALVNMAKKVEGFRSMFDADVGNWEGFTLGEHTETALQNFDENYANELPVSMLAPMRLLLLAHDIGKPAAVAAGDKGSQSQYNVRYADEFYTKLGIDGKLKGMLVAIIGRGDELTHDIHVNKGGRRAEAAMDAYARKTLEYYYGSKDITPNQIGGFRDICDMLFVCDGGSYTSMAVTRRKGKGAFRNAPSFNASFEKPTGLGKRDIHLRKQ